MAANPMQRKTRLSFLLGMLVAILIATMIIMLLFVQIKKLKDEKQALIDAEAVKVTVYKITERVAKDGEISELTPIQIESTAMPDNAIQAEDITDEEGNLKNFKALIDIEPNTIITTSMIEEDSEDSESLRLVEYNMLTLPSTLEAGQYIDIRITYSTGADFIVASKKYVTDANSSTIWLELGEKDMLTINCAIIESYVLDGTKIYATIYKDATQAALANTYTPSSDVESIIKANSNINISSPIGMRELVNSLLAAKSTDEAISSIEAGFSTEEQSLRSAREEFLGEIGY